MVVNPLQIIYYAAASTTPLQGAGNSALQGAVQGAQSSAAPTIINSIAGSIQDLIVSAAFLMFLIAIFYYVSSGGDSKKVGKAKEYLTSAVTALIALVLVKMFITSDIIELGAPKAVATSFAANPIPGILNVIHGSSTDPMAIFHVASVILTGITGLILEIIPIFSLIIIMYAGLQYIFSAGNPKKSEEAVKLLNSAIIGFAIFLMLYALWYFIIGFIGI